MYFGSLALPRQNLFTCMVISAICLGLISCSSFQNSASKGTKSAVLSEPVEPLCKVEDAAYLSSIQNLWPKLINSFDFSVGVENERVTKHLNIFERRQRYFNRVTERSETYLYHVAVEVEKRGMPAELALLPIIESGMDPFAYSHGRAAGMWQFIPSTAKIFHLDSNWWYEGRRDVAASTQAALDYLERLNKRFKGDWNLALAAYNSGSGTVYNAIKKNKKLGKPIDYWSLDLPKETSDYVPKLIALSQVIATPAAYGIELKPIINHPVFVPVDPKGQIDLAQAAKLAETPLTQIYKLNPGYNRWATEPKSQRPLQVPYDQEFIFQQNFNQLMDSERIAWKRYTIKDGDSVSTIAQKHHVTSDFLRQINHLNGNNIRIGKTLLIPSPLANKTEYTLSLEQRTEALAQRKKVGKHRVSYRVKAKDSFWSIGKKYNVGVRELSRWNGMAPGDTLRSGQELHIWLKDGNASQRSIYRKVYYSVRNGESLSHIAAKFNVSISNIKKWNKLAGEKYLQPGQRLVLNVNVAK